MYLALLSSVEPLPAQNFTVRSLVPRGFLFMTLALAWFALSPTARAVTPAPDGGYPGGNTAEGTAALFSLTTGGSNTAIGDGALYRNTTGSDNTATGESALFNNTTGFNNTGNGFRALRNNTTGYYNTGNGFFALYSNTTGAYNTATGSQALPYNTTGDRNTATGLNALFSNTSGGNNTATGADALFSNTTGSYNTANGAEALTSNTTGPYNTANGSQALSSNTTGYDNTANGFQALRNNTTGYNNAASGVQALYSNTTGRENTASGLYALSNNTIGFNNTALGASAGVNLTTGSNNIVIGAGVLGTAGDANKIRIGKSTHTATYIGGIYNKTVASATGVAVRIDSAGKLGTVLSSARYKEAIKRMDKASEAILQLEPVTFRYKQELDPDGVTQFGLIAEQVEKINPDLVVCDEQGKVNTVRYEAVNAMLLNEFLKERRKMQKLEATVAEQQKQIKALATGLQKVSDRLELSKNLSQVVAND